MVFKNFPTEDEELFVGGYVRSSLYLFLHPPYFYVSLNVQRYIRLSCRDYDCNVRILIRIYGPSTGDLARRSTMSTIYPVPQWLNSRRGVRYGVAQLEQQLIHVCDHFFRARPGGYETGKKPPITARQ